MNKTKMFYPSTNLHKLILIHAAQQPPEYLAPKMILKKQPTKSHISRKMYLQQIGVLACHTILYTSTPSVHSKSICNKSKMPPKLCTILAKHDLDQVMILYTKCMKMLSKVYTVSTPHHKASLIHTV